MLQKRFHGKKVQNNGRKALLYTGCDIKNRSLDTKDFVKIPDMDLYLSGDTTLGEIAGLAGFNSFDSVPHGYNTMGQRGVWSYDAWYTDSIFGEFASINKMLTIIGKLAE